MAHQVPGRPNADTLLSRHQSSSATSGLGHKRRCLLCSWSVRSSSDSGSTCLMERALRAGCDARRKGNKAQDRPLERIPFEGNRKGIPRGWRIGLKLATGRWPARMGRAYSEDLRSRIVTAVEAGATRTAAAAQFAVSVSCAIKLVQRFRQTGSVAPAPRGKKPFALLSTRRRFVSWLLRGSI